MVITVTVTALNRRPRSGRIELAPWSYFQPQRGEQWVNERGADLDQLIERNVPGLSEQLNRFPGYLIDLHLAHDQAAGDALSLHVDGGSIGLALVLGAVAAELGKPKTFAATGAIALAREPGGSRVVANGPAQVSSRVPKLQAVQAYATARNRGRIPYYCPPIMDVLPVQEGLHGDVDVRVFRSWADLWARRGELFEDEYATYRNWLQNQLNPATAARPARVFNDDPVATARAELHAGLSAPAQADDPLVPLPFLLHPPSGGLVAWVQSGIKQGLNALLGLRPGAPVTTDALVGKRRVYEYLLDPLLRAGTESFREP